MRGVSHQGIPFTYWITLHLTFPEPEGQRRWCDERQEGKGEGGELAGEGNMPQ